MIPPERGILFVTPWLRDGGIERVLQNSLPWLVRRGYRCEVASWNVSAQLSGHRTPVLAALAEAEVPVHILRSYGRFKLLQRAIQAAAIMLRRGHRLVVGYELEGNLVALLTKRLLRGRVNVMAQTHNASSIHAEVGTSATLLRLARRLYRDADLVVAVSKSIGADTARFFGLEPSRIVTLYNPFQIEQIRLQATETLPEAATPVGRFIVGCGRLVKMKGFPDLIRAFARVRRNEPLRLIILGEGPVRAGLVECARQEGVEDEVVMPGFVVNPWAYFKRSAAFVLPSLFGEAFPMVLVEAMACHVPVIASRCEWGPDEILEGGRYGLLYEPGDVCALAQHLGAVLDQSESLAGLLDAAGRRAERFSQDTVLPEFVSHIETLLRR